MDIIRAFEESYDEAGARRSSEAEFAPVLAAAVDPLVQMCERSADSLHPEAPSRWPPCAEDACILVFVFVSRSMEKEPIGGPGCMALALRCTSLLQQACLCCMHAAGWHQPGHISQVSEAFPLSVPGSTMATI
jgi:hypothetical protein